jgi:4-hydroxy-3-polyprenylbenzoate decarboxylase
MRKRKIVIAVSAASGSIYAQQLINRFNEPELSEQVENVSLVFSKHANEVWEHELGNFNAGLFPFRIFDLEDYNAPFASGSAQYDTMIICPCSMGTLGRIAHGVSDNLITRTADVMLKERRKLILVTREAPLSLIHVNNMKTAMEAGSIIFPASPSFYSKPVSIQEIADTVINRVIDLAGFHIQAYRWKQE